MAQELVFNLEMIEELIRQDTVSSLSLALIEYQKVLNEALKGAGYTGSFSTKLQQLGDLPGLEKLKEANILVNRIVGEQGFFAGHEELTLAIGLYHAALKAVAGQQESFLKILRVRIKYWIVSNWRQRVRYVLVGLAALVVFVYILGATGWGREFTTGTVAVVNSFLGWLVTLLLVILVIALVVAFTVLYFGKAKKIKIEMGDKIKEK